MRPRPNNQELTAALSELYQTLRRVSSTQESGRQQLDATLGDYIFFPLSHVFRQYQALNDLSIELALQCLELLIDTCWRSRLEKEMAKQLLILLTFIVGGNPAMPPQSPSEKPAEKRGGERSEETKLAGCRCLIKLFGSIERNSGTKGSINVVEEFENMPAVGHTVSTLLATFSGAEMLQLQLSVLQCLDKLIMETIKDEDMRAGFYPGVISGLVKALGLGKTTKRPFLVLRDMVKVLDRLISSVLSNRNVAALPDSGKGVEDITGPGTLRLRRTQSWLKTTAANTGIVLKQILKLRAHSKLEVRMAVFELCRNLMESCSLSLGDATMVLVETLMVISGDVDESLKSLAEGTLRVIASMDEKVKDAIRDCLDRFIAGLPRIMTGNDEDAKQQVITRLSVAFKLCIDLGMESDLLRDMLAEGIKDCLTAVTTSKKANISVQSSSTHPRIQMLLIDRTHTRDGDRLAKFPDVILSQRSQAVTVDSVKQLVESLGNSSQNGLSLAQRYIRDASAWGISKNECAISFWIALNLLRGSLKTSNEIDIYFDFNLMETSHLQRRVTDEIMALALSNLNTSVEAGSECAENTITYCLALETLSLVAETQKRQFRGELVDALYPVVHHLGSSSAEVQQHAIVALNNIAYSCEYTSARDLLLDNVDYMVDAVSLKLNIFDLSPQTPVVLNMLLKLVGSSLVPYLDDLIFSIFTILDGFHEYEKLCEELFVVLAAIVEESTKADEDVKILGSGNDDLNSRMNKKLRFLKDDEVVKSLQDLRYRSRLDPLDRLESEAIPDDGQIGFPHTPWGKDKSNNEEYTMENMNNDQHTVPPPQEETRKLSKTYEIVQRITRLSQHYLTHSSFTLRSKILTLVSIASHTLASNEAEYLPIVNDLWPVVYGRLFDDEAAVVIQSAQAISSIAETAGDFLSTRVTEGWSGIKRVYLQALTNLEKERRAKTADMGSWGTNYKVWNALVVMLISIVRYTGANDTVLDGICAMCGGAMLRERTDLREALEDVVPDSVWLELESWEKTTRWEYICPTSESAKFLIPTFLHM